MLGKMRDYLCLVGVPIAPKMETIFSTCKGSVNKMYNGSIARAAGPTLQASIITFHSIKHLCACKVGFAKFLERTHGRIR